MFTPQVGQTSYHIAQTKNTAPAKVLSKQPHLYRTMPQDAPFSPCHFGEGRCFQATDRRCMSASDAKRQATSGSRGSDALP